MADHAHAAGYVGLDDGDLPAIEDDLPIPVPLANDEEKTPNP